MNQDKLIKDETLRLITVVVPDQFLAESNTDNKIKVSYRVGDEGVKEDTVYIQREHNNVVFRDGFWDFIHQAINKQEQAFNDYLVSSNLS